MYGVFAGPGGLKIPRLLLQFMGSLRVLEALHSILGGALRVKDMPPIRAGNPDLPCKNYQWVPAFLLLGSGVRSEPDSDLSKCSTCGVL